MSSLPYTLLVLASCTLVSCKARKPAPPGETATPLPSQLPAPVSKGQGFAVGDDVSIIDDDGTFEIEGHVTAVRDAPKGYTVRVGNGRRTVTRSLAPSQVFPPPWASSARVRVGDTIYERSSSSYAPPKCVAQEVPADVHEKITALCDDAKVRWIARENAFYAIEPATLNALSTGDIMYYENQHWVMVVGTAQADGRVAIRRKGIAAQDQLVSVSKLQRVR